MNEAFLLFTKVPTPGLVKTRLTEGANGLSPEGACRLYSAILSDVFDVLTDTASSVGASVCVAYTPSQGSGEIRRVLASTAVPISFFPQEGSTTSDRILNAFGNVFSNGVDAAVLIFGDQPSLSRDLLLDALNALRKGSSGNAQRLVLGPTCDGGTYLIGLTRSTRTWLSENIDCTDSSKAVSKLVVHSLNGQVSCTLLEELIDLDDLCDLELLMKRPPRDAHCTIDVMDSICIKRFSGSGKRISVVIPTLNEEANLERIIRLLRNQKFVPKEIIVVDCGSHDRTLLIANTLADRVVVVNRCGRAHQENVGGMGAKGDILLFLHADTLVSPSLLAGIEAALADRDVTGGGAHLSYVPRRLRYRALCVLRNAVSKRLSVFGMGSSFFVRRRAFLDIGGFDEAMNEEGVDMSKKLRAFGRLVMLNEVVQTSARRFERLGFLETLLAWGITVGLSFMAMRAHAIEKYIWRNVR